MLFLFTHRCQFCFVFCIHHIVSLTSTSLLLMIFELLYTKSLLFTSRTIILPGSNFLRVSFILNYSSPSFSFSTLLFQFSSMETSGLLHSSYFLQFCCCSKWHKYPASAETKRCFSVKKKNNKNILWRAECFIEPMIVTWQLYFTVFVI